MKTLSTQYLGLNEIADFLSKPLSIEPADREKVRACRAYLDAKMQDDSRTYYGINTGFGALCHVRISKEDIEALQENLVLSHACGVGDEVPDAIVRIMLLLKIRNFLYGHSGVSEAVLDRMTYFYNNDILPVVYKQGSLGASGDLAPLAHLCLPLLKQGKVKMNGVYHDAAELNFDALRLQSKEGLALLNGTQFMSSYAVHCLLQINRLLDWAELIAAVSFEGFDATPEPFNALIHTIRHHAGQQATAQNMLRYLQGSELATRKKQQVQDPYSFRCIPQVHGATRDAVAHVQRIVEQEINAVTDNPLVFPEEDLILSGGNFHGQPLAINLDYLAIAVAELANISERRTYLLISGQRNLPPFLIESAGLDSGLMIAQYTAASIVSKNKQLCTPASVDSIVSSNGQEDHVSMGANAATKLYEVVENVTWVLAIELLNAAQALEFRRPAKSSPIIEKMMAAYREVVPFMNKDRILHNDMAASRNFILKHAVEEFLG